MVHPMLFSPKIAVLVIAWACLVACNNHQSVTASEKEKMTPTSSHPIAIKLSPFMPDLKFKQPLFLLQSPNSADDWYVLEKQGRIYRARRLNGHWEKSLFLDISAKVDASESETGLLGMSFDPDFATNGYLYVSYTAHSNKRQVSQISTLARYQYRKSDTQVDPASASVILKVDQPFANHNGGHIAFSSRGLLYWGLGDGGSGGDPKGNGQNTQTLLGSLLRIDVSKLPYTIPSSNPFVDGGGRKEIFAWGLRNPWRYSFDRESGRLWLADVGQNDWEEVNLVQGGNNLGWNGREASHCYIRDLCDNAQFIDPIVEYDHGGGRCSITGGYVYRGQLYPELRGMYFYADFCTGEVWAVTQSGNGTYFSHRVLESGLNIASFAEDNQGELYVLHLGGTIHKIEAVP